LIDELKIRDEKRALFFKDVDDMIRLLSMNPNLEIKYDSKNSFGCNILMLSASYKIQWLYDHILNSKYGESSSKAFNSVGMTASEIIAVF
jgi:hypothetical protein